MDMNTDNAIDVDINIDEATFADPAETHRRELRVHCYRLLGSVQEASSGRR